jgi:hypothetical protein
MTKSVEPEEVTIVAMRRSSVLSMDDRGHLYIPSELHATKTLAVIAALEKLDAKEESLKRQMLRLEKQRAALEKARVEK